MAERDLLVTALAKEVLGPRAGANEVLPAVEDPLDEYITGVLAPHRVPSIELDADEDLLGEDDQAADDQADPGSDVQFGGIDLGGLPSPSLDPRCRPASLGISFAVEGDSPAVSLACTWARYMRTDTGGWRREPRGELLDPVDCTQDHQVTATSDSGVRTYVRSRRDGTQWRVSAFLVNETVCRDRPGTEDHVFQPQIRVSCADGTTLVPVQAMRSIRADDEEESLRLLYRGQKSLARGHLCSALWRSVDPERPHPSIPLPAEIPFAWIDGDAVFGAAVRARFSPSDIRTEYVPIVPVNAPDKTWPHSMAAPELDPQILSETWGAQQLRSALEPLADGYEQWIQTRQSSRTGLDPSHQPAASRHLQRAQEALTRIRAAIDLLASDDDVRLAFCFANRAIALQSRWTKDRVNPWWPFQLAFQLLNIPGVVSHTHPDRDICDLLWFPTGGGKTEAYLGLAAFTLAYRRLSAFRQGAGDGGAGVGVLSRYTLRLLTIQQFRRALALITACERLRIESGSGHPGWRPADSGETGDWIWGRTRFSGGLWVGGGVTPNNMQDFTYRNRRDQLVTVHGAVSILEGRADGEADGEPAQVLRCPACDGVLAIPPEGYQPGEPFELHLVLVDAAHAGAPPAAAALSTPPFQVAGREVSIHTNTAYCTLTLTGQVTDEARPAAVDRWIRDHVRRSMGSDTEVVAARPSRPGYFIREARWTHGRLKPVDFEIFCPNPECELGAGVRWDEATPSGPWPAFPAFADSSGVMQRCPVPAWTVDEQIYARAPSMVIATVDKFARLAFEPRAGSLFGNVERHNEHLGYYRRRCAPLGPSGIPTHPGEDPISGRNVQVSRFRPPDLVLQDELHLIEGPLGSMVGIYETAIDMLASMATGSGRSRAKYIASTATVRNAETQVQSLYLRSLRVFPPPGLDVHDSFFARSDDPHPLDSAAAGSLYVGICAPGRGAQTPIVRMWSRLLQHAADRLAAGVPRADLDPFWTLVGYFNAIRELAGAVALTRQDIVQRLATISATPRCPEEHEPIELSSRADSMSLPAMLDHLNTPLGGASSPPNVVVATSMFGTGVDVDRLGLMVVLGQPKTTSSYIQATGRVGRREGGLVTTFYRASRPRDLNHYEFFASYHTSLYRFVEPITVNPYAPRARDRALGPVAVALLRQAVDLEAASGTTPVRERWRVQQRIQRDIFCLAHEMARARTDPDVQALPDIVEARAQGQPGLRRPAAGDAEAHAESELDCWQQLAARTAGRLVYSESTLVNPPSRPVVLGDLAHEVARTGIAYEDAPNSLRDVEATITVRGWR